LKSIEQVLKDIRPEFDFAASEDFMGDGMLDSFDMVTLVSDLDRNTHLDFGRRYPTGEFPEYRGHREVAGEIHEVMNFTFSHRKISGLLAIVPANERTFIEEMANFRFSGGAFDEAQAGDGLR